MNIIFVVGGQYMKIIMKNNLKKQFQLDVLF